MANTAKQSPSALASVGIDIGKNVFHIVGFDPDGKIVLRRKIKRLALVSEFKKLPACIVGMEARPPANLVSHQPDKQQPAKCKQDEVYVHFECSARCPTTPRCLAVSYWSVPYTAGSARKIMASTCRRARRYQTSRMM